MSGLSLTGAAVWALVGQPANLYYVRKHMDEIELKIANAITS